MSKLDTLREARELQFLNILPILVTFEVTKLVTNQQRTVLVFGTSNGILAVADIQMNYKFLCVFNLSGRINSISVLGDVFAAGSESGNITLFSANSPTQHQTLQVPKPVVSLALGANWLLAAVRESSEVIIWNV